MGIAQENGCGTTQYWHEEQTDGAEGVLPCEQRAVEPRQTKLRFLVNLQRAAAIDGSQRQQQGTAPRVHPAQFNVKRAVMTATATVDSRLKRSKSVQKSGLLSWFGGRFSTEQ